jgi:hypothetical protein
MALAPHPAPAKPQPTGADIEAAFEAHVAEVERVVDAWISHKDRTQPQAVPLPRMQLDAPHLAEITRRYQTAGWALVEIVDGVLHLHPTAPVLAAQE